MLDHLPKGLASPSEDPALQGFPEGISSDSVQTVNTARL